MLSNREVKLKLDRFRLVLSIFILGTLSTIPSAKSQGFLVEGETIKDQKINPFPGYAMSPTQVGASLYCLKILQLKSISDTINPYSSRLSSDYKSQLKRLAVNGRVCVDFYDKVRQISIMQGTCPTGSGFAEGWVGNWRTRYCIKKGKNYGTSSLSSADVPEFLSGLKYLAKNLGVSGGSSSGASASSQNPNPKEDESIAAMRYECGPTYYMSDHKKALDSCNRLVRDYPNNASSYLDRGRTLIEKGDISAACTDLNKAKSLSSTRLTDTIEDLLRRNCKDNKAVSTPSAMTYETCFRLYADKRSKGLISGEEAFKGMIICKQKYSNQQLAMRQ